MKLSEIATPHDLFAALLNQLRSLCKILCQQEMAHRFLVIAMTLIPVCRPVVQIAHKIGLALLQPYAQELGEELVIALQGVLLIQRDDKQVGLLQMRELHPAVRILCHLLAERRTQAL